MCSDGLTNMLRDNEIYNILLKNPDKPVEALIRIFNEKFFKTIIKIEKSTSGGCNV